MALPHPTSRLGRALALIDAHHARDPVTVTVDGEPVPRELARARRVCRWVERLAPDASEPLRLAARCQHLRSWDVPRHEFPPGRAGYLGWRRRRARHHGVLAEAVVRAAGYDAATAARVAALVRKEGLGADAEAGILEDAACLAFLEAELQEFARGRDPALVVRVLRRTWRKMTPEGRSAAAELRLPVETRMLLDEALGPPP